MGSLVTHACSGVSGEVDVALELLCELVSQRPAEMSQFTVFVKVRLPARFNPFLSSVYYRITTVIPPMEVFLFFMYEEVTILIVIEKSWKFQFSSLYI